MHGGSIAAESALGEGTTFIVTVPLGSAHVPAGQIGESNTFVRSSTRANPYVEEALQWLPDEDHSDRVQRDDDHRPRVLVADDNTDMRQYLVRLLADRYSTEAVADGEAALARARKQPPDLIVTDVMMPRLDGFGLVRELRADPRTRYIPVMMLSARAGEESRIEGMAAGVDDYLAKPFSAVELLARVGARLQLARLRREPAEVLHEADRRTDDF